MSTRTSLIAESKLDEYRTIKDKTAACIFFAKDICNFVPRPHQIFYINELLHNDKVVVAAPPRAGKTVATELVDLFDMLMNPFEDLRIYAPKLGQCKETYNYIHDWISKSKILKAYIRRKNGKMQHSSMGCEFKNGSNAKLYSIKGELEGHNATILRFEEFDDWPWEKFANDVMRRVAAINENGLKNRMRFTGTIQGKDNLYKLLHEPAYKEKYKSLHKLPDGTLLDVYYMLAVGALDLDSVEDQRLNMTSDEWARSMLLKFPDSSSFFKNHFVRSMLKRSHLYGVELAKYGEDTLYNKVGTIALGFDTGHGGQSSSASKFIATFTERVGQAKRLVYIKTWESTVNDKVLLNELTDLCEYFQVDGGHGDALKMMFVQQLNRQLYLRNISTKNPDDYPENKPSHWQEWCIIPLHNNDKHKHEMYSSMQLSLEKGSLFIPYYDANDETLEAIAVRKLLRVMDNIRAKTTHGLYPSYKGQNKIIGDDETDALGMGVKWLHDRPYIEINYGIVKASGQASVSSRIGGLNL